MATALVIEDNLDNMKLITFLLNKSGYETREAFTGQAGIDLALAERPDFIILDIQLPDINGFEVLKTIRASPIDDTIPIIAMTSFAMTGDRARLMAAGCNGYIEKPIDPMTVMDQIREVLGEVAWKF